MEKEFLPIGSVVQLKDSTAPVMVAGYLSVMESDPNKIWDYSGFIFPLGYTDNDKIYCFDREQIEEVIVYGYMDVVQQEFVKKIAGAKAEIDEKAGEEE